jgi:hypothetical protein
VEKIEKMKIFGLKNWFTCGKSRGFDQKIGLYVKKFGIMHNLTLKK